MYDDHYVINWDAVQTIDDIKAILKALDISFGPDHPAMGDLARYVELQPNNPHVVLRT